MKKPTVTTAASMRIDVAADDRSAAPCTMLAPTTIGSSARCGCAAWPPLPVMRMSQRSAAASSGPGSRGDVAERHARLVVDREDRVAGEFLEQAVLDHRPAAAAALLGRLEDEVHGAVEVALLAQDLGGAQQHRRVAVMAAGMHAAVVLRAMLEIVASRPSAGSPCRRAGRWRVSELPLRRVPTTPVLPRPACTSRPHSASLAATMSEVRVFLDSRARDGRGCRGGWR